MTISRPPIRIKKNADFLLSMESSCHDKLKSHAAGAGPAAVYIKEKRAGWITRVFVKKNCRKLGIATLMSKEAEKWFRSRKINSVYPIVHARNSHAIGLCERLGFRDFRKEMRLGL